MDLENVEMSHKIGQVVYVFQSEKDALQGL